MKNKKPKILVFSGYGLNCEEETKYAFDLAGGVSEIVHINDLVLGIKKVKNYDILAFPGGFSFGDDTGSGKAYANKVRNHLMKDIELHIEKGGLVIGICNGFQILTNLGILPGALTHNSNARYIDRWVDIKVEKNNSPWLKNISTLFLPIAHGEGRFIGDTNDIAFKYTKGEISNMMNLPYNPNGAERDIAGVLSKDGRIIGMMPHPERGMFMSQLPHFQYIKEKAKRDGKKLEKFGPGFQIFKNGVDFFKK